jgi:hypothetical protein
VDSIEAVSRKTTESKLTAFYVMAKIRPSDMAPGQNQNVGKYVHTRYHINFKVLKGLEKNRGHEIMNDLSMRGLISLVKATGNAPDDLAEAGLSAALLRMLFPLEGEQVAENPLLGAVVVANIVNSPNKGAGARKPRQTHAETWSPFQQGE